MHDLLPETLYRTKRGLCPCCGAPLSLDEDTSHLTCGFCGGSAVLERRLRRAEPEVPGAPLRQFHDRDHAGWERTDRLRESYASRPTCPGCGLGIDEPEHGSRFACPSCGTDCHLERRLVPPARNPLRGTPRPRHPRETYVYDLGEDDDPRVEHLIYRLSREPDEDRATALAQWFERWNCINPTTARLMPALLERVHRGGRPLAYEASSAISKCLCSTQEMARETVAALEEWVVRVPADRLVISSLGLGKAIGLKLLLDSSMLAHTRGDHAQSVACLFAINWMLQRNYDEHPIISQILMHRMFYLSGPPLAFCVMFMHRQVSDVAFRYDPRTTLSFLDDAVAERPILVPSLDHERAFYAPDAADAKEWEDRLAFCRGLRSEEARLAAWKHYLRPPESAPADFHARHTAMLLEMIDDERPRWRELGEKRLEWVVRNVRPTPEAVMSLVRARGESLPGSVRLAMLSEHPKCGLEHKDLPYWKPEPKPEEDPQIVEARRQYREGLDAALAGRDDDRNAWTAYWEARGGRTKDFPEIFDGSCEAPPPPERRSGGRMPAPRPWEAATVASEARGARPAPGDETAPPEDEELAELLALSRAEMEALEQSGEDDDEDGDQGDEGPEPGDPGMPHIPSDGEVTIWEWVASLPPEQQRQYDEMLRQLEPHRAMIEAAMAAKRAASGPGPGSGRDS